MRLFFEEMAVLGRAFFERDVLVVARELVGKELRWGGCSGIVVETEAYGVEGDAACHTASRKGARDFFAEHGAGTAYVYLNYGMYWLLNVLAKPGEGNGRDGIVLIRALEPRGGIGLMRERRGRERLEELCSGPGKLGVALGITGSDHGKGLLAKGEGRCFAEGGDVGKVRADVRVGISKARDLRWRFLVEGNPHVSVAFGKA